MEAAGDVEQREADLAGSGLPHEVVDHLDLSCTTWITHQCRAQQIGVGTEHFGVGLGQELVAHSRASWNHEPVIMG
jgi:hypothetical protein